MVAVVSNYASRTRELDDCFTRVRFYKRLRASHRGGVEVKKLNLIAKLGIPRQTEPLLRTIYIGISSVSHDYTVVSEPTRNFEWRVCGRVVGVIFSEGFLEMLEMLVANVADDFYKPSFCRRVEGGRERFSVDFIQIAFIPLTPADDVARVVENMWIKRLVILVHQSTDCPI